jgi:hypothetical protein
MRHLLRDEGQADFGRIERPPQPGECVRDCENSTGERTELDPAMDALILSNEKIDGV